MLILPDGRVVADDSVANLRELRRRPALPSRPGLPGGAPDADGLRVRRDRGDPGPGEASRAGYVTSVGLPLLARLWLVRRRDGQAAASDLVFDDQADPHVTVLGLEGRQPADQKPVRIEERASRA